MENNTFMDIFIHQNNTSISESIYKKDSFIIHEGEQLSEFYFVTKGTLKVYQDYLNGKRILVGFFQAPAILGDIEYLLDYNEASCTVEATTDIYLYKIPYSNINKEYKHNTQFQMMLLKEISNKLMNSNKKISLNLMYPLETRLASYILSLSKAQHSETIYIYNLSDLADHLGTSYRHLTRTLKVFKDSRIIKKDGHEITILNKKELSQKGEGNIYEMEHIHGTKR